MICDFNKSDFNGMGLGYNEMERSRHRKSEEFIQDVAFKKCRVHLYSDGMV